MKFDRSNKLCYYGQVNSKEIKCSFKMGKQTPFGGNIYFAGDDALQQQFVKVSSFKSSN